MDAPEGGPQLVGKACPCPASKLCTMSQFAPFLHEPVFWKTVPGGFAVDLAAAFGLALGLALAAPALPPPFPPPLRPLALSPRLAAVAVVAEVEADLTCRSLPATLGARTGRQGAVLGRRARRPGRGCLGSGLELADLLLRLCQGRRGVRRLTCRGRTSSAPPLREPLLVVARTQGPPCETPPTWQGTGDPLP